MKNKFLRWLEGELKGGSGMMMRFGFVSKENKRSPGLEEIYDIAMGGFVSSF